MGLSPLSHLDPIFFSSSYLEESRLCSKLCLKYLPRRFTHRREKATLNSPLQASGSGIALFHDFALQWIFSTALWSRLFTPLYRWENRGSAKLPDRLTV